MHHPHRTLLLALALVLSGGASDFAEDDAPGVSHYTPSGAFGAYLSGRFAAHANDMDMAADEFAQVLNQDGDVQEVATQAFIAAVLAGRPSAHVLALRQLDNPVALLLLANQDAKAGHWAEAEARVRALPGSSLTQILQPLLLAWCLEGQGRTQAAVDSLRPAMEAGPYRGIMALHAALIADEGGQNGTAATLYQTARADAGGINLRLGQIIASWQARQGLKTEAEATIRAVVAAGGEVSLARAGLEADMDNRAVRQATDGMAEVYLAIAATLRQQEALETSQIMLRFALDLRPGFTPAKLVLADALSAGRNLNQAQATLATIPKGDPLAPIVTVRRASLLERMGDVPQAKALLEELADAEPDRPEPLAQIGGMLRAKEDFTAAIEAYDRAIARIAAPNRANWPLFYERGVALERSGQWPRAEADFRFALELAPDQPNVLNYLGYAWADRGEHLVEASGMVQRAVAQRPNDGSIIDSLGWILLRQGDAPGALKQLERAVELEPEDPVINGHLGDALVAVGRKREAEFQWRRALNLKPDPDDKRAIETKLRALTP